VTAKRFDLLIAGELNPDAILLAETIEPEFGQVERLVDDGVLTIGSSGGIVACGAARLGMRTAYVSVVGDDASGQFMLGELRRRGVDVDGCRVEPGQRTGLTVVLSKGGDRAILTSLGAMTSLTAADVSDEMLGAAEHLHVSSPHLQGGLLQTLGELFARAHRAGASTSLDPGWDPGGAWADGLGDALGAVDVFLPNAAEACRFAGLDDPAAALDGLAERVETVVVKLGAEGAIARRGDETASADAPSLAAVDATGAGDSFTAGFLCGLRGGQPLADALRLGVACGSLSTRALGGVDAQPDLAEAAELAEALPSRETSRSGA
jgi:sugar/nucleoside kinase (ribokinase family)